MARDVRALLAACLAAGTLAGCGPSKPVGVGGGDAAVEQVTEVQPEEVAGPETGTGIPFCFIKSGDGHDAFQDGTPAVVVTATAPWGAACGDAWVSTNADGFTKPELPVTELLRRDFSYFDVPEDLVTFTISYAVDDGAEIILNGHSLDVCSPSAPYECSRSCRVVTVPRDALVPEGSVNTLSIKMTNSYNVNAGEGHTGWTGISYAVCMTFK